MFLPRTPKAGKLTQGCETDRTTDHGPGSTRGAPPKPPIAGLYKACSQHDVGEVVSEVLVAPDSSSTAGV